MDFTSRAMSIMASGFLNLLMAAIIYWKYRKRKIARIFVMTTFLMAGYCWLTAGLASAKTEETTLLWLRIFMPFAYWLVALVFHFSVLFSRTDNRWTRGYSYFAYAFVFVLSLIKVLNFSNGAEYRTGQGWFPADDVVYACAYVPFLYITFFLALLLVVRRMIKTPSDAEKNRLWFFFLAIGSALALDSTVLLPNYDFLAPFSTLAFNLILAFAITRHRLFDLSLAVKKGTLAAGFSFIIVVGLVAAVFKIQELVIIRELGFGFFTIVSTALVVSVLLPFFWSQVSKWVNRFFGVRILSLEQRLLEYTLLLDRHFQLDDYFAATLDKLGQEMGVSKSWVFIKDAIKGGFTVAASSPKEDSSLAFLAPETLLARELERLPRILDCEELLSAFDDDVIASLDGPARKALAEEMAGFGVAVAFPIFIETRLEAVLLLSGKVSDSIYSSRELDFLQALCSQLAAALENSRLHKQIQQADRLSTMGTLSSSLAHELRNPLTAISDFVEMMPSRYADEGFRKKFSHIVGMELEKLIALTDQLLTFSRPSKGQNVPLNFGNLCAGACQLLNEQFSKKGVALKIEGTEGAVMGKEAELSQVLVNLLLNALQATPQGGEVVLKVLEYDKNIFVSVTDNGCGMTPEQLKHIFNPFFTTKKGGTGLGLAMCMRVIEQHGGSFSVTSRVEQGSCFVVRLPSRLQEHSLAA